MADTHEEQLLSRWLRDIAREDEGLRAEHLETQVMSAARPMVRLKPDTTYFVRTYFVRAYYVRAAAIVISVLVPAVLWIRSAPADESVRRAANPPSVVVPQESTEQAVDIRAHGPVRTRPTAMRTARHSATNPMHPTNPSIPTTSMIPTDPTIPTTPTNLTIPTNPTIPTIPTPPADEFVPLMPMTPQELTGPFQIVRVQMPRASLGALRSPLDHPGELVEADVLLSEDGMARAIRVSTGGSIYSWRSR